MRIPAGATIVANVWGMLQDPEIHEDPTAFNPLDSSDSQRNLARRISYSDSVNGKSTCIYVHFLLVFLQQNIAAARV